MTDRDRLAQIILKARINANPLSQVGYAEADALLANGVTLGKPLVEYLHPIDAYEGLKGKYLVFKADTGEQIVNCFVLRPDKDNTAAEALRFYAYITDNKTLAEDIYTWVGKSKILPPCKVGDIVYSSGYDWQKAKDVVTPYQITNITITQNKNGVWTKKYRAMRVLNGKTIDCQLNFEFDAIGKTVFLTKEEAERKLKELRDNGKV